MLRKIKSVALLSEGPRMYRTNTKSCEHDATSVDSLDCTANMGENLISAITCCLTSVDPSKIRPLIVSLDKGTC